MQINQSSSWTILLWSFITILLSGFSQVLNAEEKSTSQWEIRNNDRIVLLGSTFIERENNYGQIEMSLRLAYPDFNLSIRNLGWSGDNVLGESRAYFGTVEQGYAHLKEYVKLTDPTLLIVSYGHNASFEGESGLPSFIKKYQKLLTDLKAQNRRIVVLGPTMMEAVVISEQEVVQFHKNRKMYGEAIQKMCASNGFAYVEMLDRMLLLKKKFQLKKLTTNGVHFGEPGYIVAGEAVLNSLGKTMADRDQLLFTDSQFHSLSLPLEKAILQKNELFFHRFRPQNETYLRGFRKHEQGQNAKEIYQFDALVEAQEKKLTPLVNDVKKAWWK